MAFSTAFLFAAAAVSAPHDNLNATLWYQTSAEFRANSLQTYKMASLTLKDALTDTNWTALPTQTTDFQHLPPAIIVDIDETILDNSPAAAQAILEQDHGFNLKRWDRWVAAAKAQAVPGAVDFLNLAGQNGVTVLYITNRECAPRAAVKDSCPQKTDTLKNLQARGVKHVDASQVWLKSEQKDWTSEKESRRLKAAQQYRVIMLLGDDFGDFLPQVKHNITPVQRFELVDKYQHYWGSRWFMLTNPTYGSWETILQQPKQQYLQGF